MPHMATATYNEIVFRVDTHPHEDGAEGIRKD